MADLAPFNATTKPLVYLERDWNSLCDHGLEKTASYIVRVNGAYYEAIQGGGASGAGTIAFGGADNAGTVDGTTADTVIQACLDNLTTGGKIFIKKGVYALSDVLYVKSSTWGITIEGESVTKDDSKAGTIGTVLSRGAQIMEVQGYVHGLTIKNIEFYNTDTVTSDLVLGVDDPHYTSFVTIENCVFHGGNYGINLYSSCDTYIIRCHFYNQSQSNIYAHPAAGMNRPNTIVITQCTLRTATAYGIYIDDCDAVYITHCVIESMDRGILCEGLRGGEISHNWFENFGNENIYLTDGSEYCTQIQIENNELFEGDGAFTPAAPAIYVAGHSNFISVFDNKQVYTEVQVGLYVVATVTYFWAARNNFNQGETILCPIHEAHGKELAIGNGGTIAHGMHITPTSAFLTGNPDKIYPSIASLDSTNITINLYDILNDVAYAGTIVLYWYAKYEE